MISRISQKDISFITGHQLIKSLEGAMPGKLESNKSSALVAVLLNLIANGSSTIEENTTLPPFV